MVVYISPVYIKKEKMDKQILNHYYYFKEIEICVGLAYDDDGDAGKFSVVISLHNYYAHIHLMNGIIFYHIF